MKKGFTIIELLMVMAILAVLLGIITTAATASIRQSRDRQTQAMKLTLQNGMAAYRVRNDEWPGTLNDWSDKVAQGKVGYLSNNDYEVYTFTASETDGITFNALRMSDGKKIIGKVGINGGAVTVIDEESNMQINYLERIN